MMSVAVNSTTADKDALAELREETFHNLHAAGHYGRIAEQFLELADDRLALEALRMMQGYFEAALKNFAPLRDIVDARRSKRGVGD